MENTQRKASPFGTESKDSLSIEMKGQIKSIYTQGKWYVVNNFATDENHDFQIACNCKNGSRQVAQITKRNYSLYNDLPTLEESKANAHLISASPDMYETLKKITTKLCDIQNGDSQTMKVGRQAGRQFSMWHTI